MATLRPGRRADLERWLSEVRPEVVGEREWDALLRDLAPVSESYLRRLLRESGVALAPLVEGVRQDSLERLEVSLLAMLDEYEAGKHAAARKAVITAKDHARLAARKPEKRAEPEKRAQKDEMILWMITWLENPPLFRDWLRLRKKVLAHA
jgi:hypothetical protein